MRVLALTLLFACAVFGKHEKYAGWRSYYVGPPTAANIRPMRQILEKYEADVLGHPTVNRAGVAVVRPETEDQLLAELDAINVPYKVHENDVKAALDIEENNLNKSRQKSAQRNGGKTLPYDTYQTWEELTEYLQDIAARYPNLATLEYPADSFHGRPLIYLKISNTNFADNPNKPVILIDGGIHAREWITPPPVAYAIHKLLEDPDQAYLLDQFDWILMPLVNPDGYHYTFAADRFWRKTFSNNTNHHSVPCPGVDGNRNYDFFWNTVGVSSTACTDTWPGNEPFSEIETRVIRDIMLEHLHRLPLYLSMHSYGSMFIYSWGHDGSLSPNFRDLQVVGEVMAEAIDAVKLPNFPNYQVGNTVEVIGYAASGTSHDYAQIIGIPFSYCLELPGLGQGAWGFVLDPEYIPQVCEETWQGIVAGALRIRESYYP